MLTIRAKPIELNQRNPMKALLKLLALVVLLTALASRVQAVSESINTTLVFGQPFEQYFPNEFDLVHPKLLVFDATATFLGGAPGPIAVSFDWLDLTGGVVVSTPVFLPIDPTGAPFTLHAELLIPFCPPQVSLHLEYLQPSGAVEIHGTFTHECLNHVPDAGSSWSVLAMALGTMAWFGHRRVRNASV